MCHNNKTSVEMENKMRKTRTAKLVLCAVVLAASCAVMAAEDKPSLSTSVSAAFMSKYIWRGQLLNDDYVMQPSVGLSYGGLSASLWGNVDMTDYHDNNWEFTEYDWTVGYADKVPGLDFLKYSVGAIYYHLSSTTVSTTEVYGGLGLDVPLSPTVTLYRDIDEGDCTYVALSVSHSIEKICELSSDMPVGMSMSASVGWGNEAYNKYYWGVEDSALNDLTLSVGFPVPVLGWTVTPSVNYVTLLDSDIRSVDTYETGYTNKRGSDYLFTGLTLSKSF
jgi:uncharacterized protein (TIGR02001 family)